MEKTNTLKPDITFSQDLTAAALSYTTSIARKFKLSSIHFKATGNITETITITKDSKQGATYDTVLKSISLVAQSSYVYRPEADEDFQSGDEIKIQCTDAGGVETIKGVIKVRELD